MRPHTPYLGLGTHLLRHGLHQQPQVARHGRPALGGLALLGEARAQVGQHRGHAAVVVLAQEHNLHSEHISCYRIVVCYNSLYNVTSRCQNEGQCGYATLVPLWFNHSGLLR